MKQRIMSLLVCFTLLIALPLGLNNEAKAAAIININDSSVFLKQPSEAEEAANELYKYGLFRGTGTNPDGTPIFDLDRAPTRAEAVTMLVRLLGKETEALDGKWVTPFTDVYEWAKPYVGYAYANGLTSGVSDTKFGSSDKVTATQYLTFVLRSLGYFSDTEFLWNRAWELTDSLEITDGRYNASSSGFTRGDTAIISRNALRAKLKNGTRTLLESMYVSSPLADGTYEAVMFRDKLTLLADGNTSAEIEILTDIYFINNYVDRLRVGSTIDLSKYGLSDKYVVESTERKHSTYGYGDYIDLVDSSFYVSRLFGRTDVWYLMQDNDQTWQYTSSKERIIISDKTKIVDHFFVGPENDETLSDVRTFFDRTGFSAGKIVLTVEHNEVTNIDFSWFPQY